MIGQTNRDYNFIYIDATEELFLIPISFQPDDVNFRYFKLKLFDLTAFIVWNIKVLWHCFVKIPRLEIMTIV